MFEGLLTKRKNITPTLPNPKSVDLGLDLDFGKTKTTTPAVPQENILDTLEMAKSIPQSIARSGASVGLTVTRSPEIKPEELRPGLERKAFETLFGEEPIKPIEQRVAETELTLQKKGLELPGGIKIPVKGAETPLALFGVGATIGLDFTGWGGGKTGLTKYLTKTTKVEDVAKALRAANVAEDLITDYAPVIAKLDKTEDVGKALSRLEALQKTTKTTSQEFQGFKDLTTKFLNYAKGKITISKQEILDFAKRPELKKGEADLLNKLGSEVKEAKIPAQEFADYIRRDLLELKPAKVKENQYSNISIDRQLKQIAVRETPEYNRIFQEEIARVGNPEEAARRAVARVEPKSKMGKNYEEVVFESPITTNGSSHYPNSKNYFAHARGDEVVESGKKIWREQEIQSDALQKEGLDMAIPDVQNVKVNGKELTVTRNRYVEGTAGKQQKPFSDFKPDQQQIKFYGKENNFWGGNGVSVESNKGSGYITLEEAQKAVKEAQKRFELQTLQIETQLQPFTNDRFGERIMRERIKEKAQKGYEKYRLPTGETIGKIEGFESAIWTDFDGVKVLQPSDLKVGNPIRQRGADEHWIITDIIGDGRFKAVPKEQYENLLKAQKLEGIGQYSIKSRSEIAKELLESSAETFDLTGKSNPQYRRYSDWGKFLKNKYGGKEVIDPQGNSWVEIDLKPEYAKAPIEAFGAFAGVQYDEETGQVKFDPKMALLGLAGGRIIKGKTLLPATAGKKTVEQVFKTGRLNLNTEQLSNIEKRLATLGLKERTIRSWQDVEKSAQELGIDVKKLLTETANSRITDKDVAALSDFIGLKSDEIIKLENQLITDPRNAQILNIKLTQAEQQLNAALKKLITGGTEAGRTVAIFRKLAERTLDPTFWLSKAKKTAGDRKLTSDEVIAITDLIKKGDRQGLANFVSMLRNPSFAEMAVAFWKAGLLTSPTTHLANIGGNVTMASLMTASDVASTGYDVLASLITGKRTTTIGLDTIAAKVKGFVAGTKGAKRYLKEGIYDADVLKKWDMPRQTIIPNKILNGYVQSVFRSLGAEDILFRQAAIQESFQKQAIVMAKNEGLKGDILKERVKELLQTPTNEMVVNAIDAAEYATFQSPNALANFIRAGKRAGGEPLRTATEFVAPFTLTPTNVAARIMDFTPAGFVKAVIQGLNPATRSQKAIVETLGRATTGSAIMGLGAYLASKGLMTGNVPEDANDRAMFYAEGKQANSILIGGYWFQLNRISPVGNLMALGAEFDELSKKEEGARLAGATALAGVKGLTQQTFLQGVSSALEVINEPERQLEKYTQRAVSGFVPSIIGRTARTIDPKLRIPDNVFEAVEEKMPILRGNVAPRRDIFGEIAPVPGGRFNLFDPFGVVKSKDDPVIKEAKSIGAVIGMPSQTISGIKLDQHEYSMYQKVQGKLLHQTLSTLIESPDYRQLSAVDKEKAFSSYIRGVRAQLNDVLFPAIMIKRYDLPAETNPEILRILLAELSQNENFNKFETEKQGKIIKKLLQGNAE